MAAVLGFRPFPAPNRSTAPASRPPPKTLNLCATRKSPRPISSSLVDDKDFSFTDPEAELIEALVGIQGRGRAASAQQLKDVEHALQTLEGLEGVSEPTSSSLIEGCWQLIFTTRPGTASPIQRTFVGVDFFKIFQEIHLKTNDPRVSNVVRFSDSVGELKVEAAATIKNGRRILFQFDRAAFSFKFLPFKVPYPVPFRLLGDEAKGWLDTTYLSVNGNIRISRGNKGTTFVLQKKSGPRQRLLSAISLGTGVREVIDEIVFLKKNGVEGDPKDLEGEWQLIWASQIVKDNGQLENQIDLFPGFRLRASGSFKTSEGNVYNVTMNDGAVLLGALEFPLNIRSKFEMGLLYIDNKIRISRGKNGVLFVHLRLNSRVQRS